MPPVRSVLALVAAWIVAATCISLGFWQLGRYRARQEENRVFAAALAAPPRALPAAGFLPSADTLLLGRWRVRGRFDQTRQILLTGRAQGGQPGVRVVTPLVRDDGGTAVLVDRGFLPADDAATAVPPADSSTRSHDVIGLVERIAPRTGDPLWHPTPADSMRLWSARWLVADSIRAALPYAVAPLLLRELPGEGVPRVPSRSMPRRTDPMIHLSYAGQWFFFALVALFGPFVLRRARRRRLDSSGGPP